MSLTTPPSDGTERPRFRLRREIPQAAGKKAGVPRKGETASLAHMGEINAAYRDNARAVIGPLPSWDEQVIHPDVTTLGAASAAALNDLMAAHSLATGVQNAGVSSVSAAGAMQALRTAYDSLQPAWIGIDPGSARYASNYASENIEATWVQRLVNRVQESAERIMVGEDLNWAYDISHELYGRLHRYMRATGEPLHDYTARRCRLPCAAGLVIAIQYEDLNHDSARDLARLFSTTALSGAFVDGRPPVFRESRVETLLTLEMIRDMDAYDGQRVLESPPLRLAMVDAMQQCLLRDLRGD